MQTTKFIPHIQTNRFIPPETILIVCSNGELLSRYSFFNEFFKVWPEKNCLLKKLFYEGLKQTPPHIILEKDHMIYKKELVELLLNDMSSTINSKTPCNNLMNRFKFLLCDMIEYDNPIEQEIYSSIYKTSFISDLQNLFTKIKLNTDCFRFNNNKPMIEIHFSEIPNNKIKQIESIIIVNVFQEYKNRVSSSYSRCDFSCDFNSKNFNYKVLAKIIFSIIGDQYKKIFNKSNIKFQMIVLSDIKYDIICELEEPEEKEVFVLQI